jgi:hypothetical protein
VLLGVGPRDADGGPVRQDAGARADELAAEVRRLKDALAAADEACAQELEELEHALRQAHARRAERELAWYEYNRVIAELSLDDRVPQFDVDPDYAPADEDAADPESPASELARQLARRADDIQLGLRHLLMIEEIRGFDLLEVGTLHAGGIGPAVFRLLDDRGRLAGGLSAERLRLEGSRSGHTVTLVLENGFESRGGERIPFDGGVRRVVLPYVDPEPWIEAAPELFPANQVVPPLDDGRFDLARLERTLNPLLREAGDRTGGGTWRLTRVEGVLGDTLQLVQLEARDPGGRLERRVFADRMTIAREGAGVRLTLRDGVIVRASARTPFVDGVFHVFLPRADGARWEAAGLPGLAGTNAPNAADVDGARETPPDDGPAGGVRR